MLAFSDVCLLTLTGSIPRELHDLTGLKLLDLSGNKIAPSMLPPATASSAKEGRSRKNSVRATSVFDSLPVVLFLLAMLAVVGGL